MQLRRLVLPLLALAACAVPAPGPAPDAGQPQDAGNVAPDAGVGADGDAGQLTTAPALWTELPGCDRRQPSVDCIRQLFPALATAAVPFARERALSAVQPNRAYVAPRWQLTAHHVLEADSAFPYGCFFADYRYAADLVPFNGPGCGQLLAAGGHPHAVACQAAQVPMGRCVDQVVSAESFDLVLAQAATPGTAALPPRAKPPQVGDEVFLVGYPAFTWLPLDVRAQLAASYPMVSRGHVVSAQGRGLVADVPAFGGSSGGPLLNRDGEVVGVAYTLVQHQRAQGTAVPAGEEDHFLVATAVDETLAGILRALQTEAVEPH